MPNMAKYGRICIFGAYLGAPNMVNWGVHLRVGKIKKSFLGLPNGYVTIKSETETHLRNGLLQQCLLLVRLQHLLDGQPAVEVKLR